MILLHAFYYFMNNHNTDLKYGSKVLHIVKDGLIDLNTEVSFNIGTYIRANEII